MSPPANWQSSPLPLTEKVAAQYRWGQAGPTQLAGHVGAVGQAVELGIETDVKQWDEQGRLTLDWHISPTDSLYDEWQARRKQWGQSAPPI